LKKSFPRTPFKKLYTGKEKQGLSKAFGMGLDESFSIGNYTMSIWKMQCVFMKFCRAGFRECRRTFQHRVAKNTTDVRFTSET
jgi:hypothetical protein